MICVQYGPITIAVRSTTRTPVSGPLGPMAATRCARLTPRLRSPLRMVHLLGGNREAVPDVVAVAVRDDGKDDGARRIADRPDMFAYVLDRPRRPIHARRFGDDGPGHPASQRDQHFACDRTGFVRQPAHRGR